MPNLININDAISAGYCVSGIKKFFKNKNLDFRSFVKNGISEEELLNTDDAMALKLVEKKNGR